MNAVCSGYYFYNYQVLKLQKGSNQLWLSVVHYLKCNFLLTIHVVISEFLYRRFNLYVFSGCKYN